MKTVYLKDVTDTFTEEECSLEHRIEIAWACRARLHSGKRIPTSVQDACSSMVHNLIYHHQMHCGYMFEA